MESAEVRFGEFLSRYTPRIVAQAESILAEMRNRLPGAVEIVYDNYNALVVGFGPTEKTSDAVFSIAFYPRWISLFFLRAAGLRDPHSLLKGSGKVARHIVLDEVAKLREPAVRELMGAALKHAGVRLLPAAGAPHGHQIRFRETAFAGSYPVEVPVVAGVGLDSAAGTGVDVSAGLLSDLASDLFSPALASDFPSSALGDAPLPLA